MADKGQQVPIVIYPRFTTLFGGLPLESYAIDVSPYEGVWLRWWTTPTCQRDVRHRPHRV